MRIRHPGRLRIGFISLFAGTMLVAAWVRAVPDLLVADFSNHAVLRYDSTTGDFIEVLVGSGLGGLVDPHGMTLGPNGDLYVGSLLTNTVLRFSGTSNRRFLPLR